MTRRRWMRRGIGLTVLALCLTLFTSAAFAAAGDPYRCTFGGAQARCQIPDTEGVATSKYQGYAKVKGRSPCPPQAMCFAAGERHDAYTYYQHWVWNGGWVLKGDWYNSKRDGGTVVYVEPWTEGWVWTRSNYNWQTQSYDWMAMRADKLTPLKLTKTYEMF